MNVEVNRVIDAPVEDVYAAWTEPGRVREWWGPAGWTAPVADMDVRVGGRSLVCMRSPEGHDLYNTWTYTKVEPGSRLEFVNHFTDASGNRLSPADLGLPPAIPDEVPHVLVFTALPDGRTELAITESGYDSEDIVAMSKTGMEQALDKLVATVATP
jgi:uncharacterized protein YndB with AHSA1/START domain